jgi:two-component system, NarL family, response regulator LiaR
MALSHDTIAARVMIVGKNPLITRALTKLLELDDDINVVGEAPTVGTAPIAEMRPDIIILDEAGQPVDTARTEQYVDEVAPDAKICLLEVLRDLTVSEMLETVKHLAPSEPRDFRPRHLHAVTPSPQRDALAALSERELEVVRLVAEGLSNKEISSRLSLSDKTVKNHISHILAKMNLTARTQVAVYAIRAGLV